MYRIDNIYISDDVAEEFFTCDLAKCQGACCVEGDLGAPLEKEELPILESVLEEVKPYLSPEGRKEIEKQGAFIRDFEGDFSTPTIDGKECAYAFYDKRGILKCGIEAAHRDGKINFQKPISCHIYPIRITKLGDAEALNYHRWHICEPACDLGQALSQPIYKFLKEALIRKYGEAWYQQLEELIQNQDKEEPEED